MLHPQLAQAPHVELPHGYRMRFYQEGDVETWVRVQQAADPWHQPTTATFERAMPGDADYLAQRVMFLVDPAGAAIGTITAWNDTLFNRGDTGQIHWVAIVAAAQGQGLAKPMLSAACAVLRARGYHEALLETDTRRIPALNLYLQSGFVPFPRHEADRQTWRAVAPQLKYACEA